MPDASMPLPRDAFPNRRFGLSDLRAHRFLHDRLLDIFKDQIVAKAPLRHRSQCPPKLAAPFRPQVLSSKAKATLWTCISWRRSSQRPVTSVEKSFARANFCSRVLKSIASRPQGTTFHAAFGIAVNTPPEQASALRFQAKECKMYRKPSNTC